MNKVRLVALAVLLLFVPLVTHARPTDEIEQQMLELKSRIAALQLQLQSSSTSSPAVSTTTNPTLSGSQGTSCAFSRVLVLGSAGSDVSCLQRFLATNRALYPEGSVTGYFDLPTQQAVQRFQFQNGIVNYGTPGTTGYGVLGPRSQATFLKYFRYRFGVDPDELNPIDPRRPVGTTTPVVQPRLSLSATPTKVSAGANATVTWSAQNVNTCQLLNGAALKASTLSGTYTERNLTATSTFTLNCSSTTGSQSTTTQVAVQSAPARVMRGTPWKAYFLSQDDIAKGKRILTSSDSYYAGQKQSLIRAADAALVAPIKTVMDKPADEIAGSGDMHDFVSLSRYYWPNPNTPDGKPWIGKDGYPNPAESTYGDHPAYQDMLGKLDVLARAYSYTGDERYAARALEIVRAWFVNPETRMNPNLNYANSIPGVRVGNNLLPLAPIQDIFDDVALVSQSSSWTSADEQGVRDWLSSYFDWLTSTAVSNNNHKRTNNLSTWYETEVIHTALLLGKTSYARTEFQNYGYKYVDNEINPDGSQPEELARENASAYSFFSLAALTRLGQLGQSMGYDLFTHVGAKGGSIPKAILFLSKYENKPFPYGTVSREIEPRDIVLQSAQFLNESPDNTVQSILDARIKQNSHVYWQYQYPNVQVSPLPKVGVTANISTLSEGTDTTKVFTLTRNGSTAQDMRVSFAITGTATRGGDYNFIHSDGSVSTVTSVTIPSGKTSVFLTIKPTKDSNSESNESVILTISSDSDYSIDPANSSATVTITDSAQATVPPTPAPSSNDSDTIMAQLTTIEAALRSAIGANHRTTWWTEKELGLSNPTIGTLAASSTLLKPYLRTVPVPPTTVTSNHYYYDNDGNVFTCGGTSSDGVNIYVGNVPTTILTTLDQKVDGGDGANCGKITWDSKNTLQYKVSNSNTVVSIAPEVSQLANVISALEQMLEYLHR